MGDLADCGPECIEALGEIEAYLDGEVETTRRVRIERHLEGCSPCMDKTEFRRHLKELVHDRCSEHAAPPELTARIEALIRSHEGPSGV